MARPKSTTSEAAIAERLTAAMGFRVTRKHIRTWREKGYPLDDPIKLARKIRNQERVPKKVAIKIPPPPEPPAPPPPTDESESEDNLPPLDPREIERELAKLQRELLACQDYESARATNTKIIGIRSVLKELREQGKYILRDVVASSAMKAGLASKGAWEKIEDDLPPMLEGLTAAQMKAKLRDFARAKCLELSSLFST